jgi:hypothetical protein
MAKETNQSDLLGKIVGTGGDYYLYAKTTPVTGMQFSHVVFGANGGTITSCKVLGVSVMTSRNYNAASGALPANYIICAGGADYIDEITLISGDAEALIFSEVQNAAGSIVL